jgi:HD-GYP domain-containing protein (c-di-GMP phosphodiesterase class II)
MPMNLRSKVKVRFYLLPTVLLTAFVVALTLATIVVSSEKLHGLAEESARTVFSLIAQRNADQLQSMITSARGVVETQSQLDPQRVVSGGKLNQAALVPVMVAALNANPQLYSLYFGLTNGEFLQVIAVRDNAHVRDTIHAPAATSFAVRLIEPNGSLNSAPQSASSAPSNSPADSPADASSAVSPPVSPPGSAANVAANPATNIAHAARRPDHWLFLAANETVIGKASREASFEASSRPWYIGAQSRPGVFITQPYEYATSQAMGLTIAEALPNGAGVFGADLALGGLDAYAQASLEGREGGIVVTDDIGRVLSSHATPRFGGAPVVLRQSAALSANPFFAEASQLVLHDGSLIASIRSEPFAYASRSVSVTAEQTLHVVAFAPMSLYAGPINHARNEIVLFAALLLLIFLPLTWYVSHRIAGALGNLTIESERIKRLDFSGEQAVQSMFHEIDLLGEAQHTMKKAIRERTKALDEAMTRLESLLESGMQLASRRTTEQVLQQTLDRAKQLVNAQAGQFWLYTDENTLKLGADSRLTGEDGPLAALELPLGKPEVHGLTDPSVWVARNRQPLRLDGAGVHGFDLSVQQSLLGHEPLSLLVIPVLTRGEKPLGVLVLADAYDNGAYATAFDPDRVRYAAMLAAQAAVALDNIALIDSQRVLMESLLQLIAGAIDAKSAYTGGHCARVPELARMLAEVASETREGPLADFRFETEEQWREFRIGTWLHDCGKVTTPEFVVDKATKLETIYNRVHEIRTRFEVLLRDAEITFLKATLAGEDSDAARATFEARRTRLVEDFAYLAQCNIGAESMASEHADRLRAIGQQTWVRHFDNRLGLSHIEEGRFEGRAPDTLPIVEHLLEDRPEHIVPRTEEQRYDARYNFRMDVPEHLYNFGELHNLSISRGTLTAEERYKINEHIVQTIVMLEQLPLPANLRRVPEYAGTHHENLAGTGYPRKLSGDALSVPARIMAIADIFEALTASDRPYKKAKSLSEAVRILANFKKNGHIDSALFDLFLSSGVYRRYAETFLAPAQIDEVDVSVYLGVATTDGVSADAG